MSTTVTPLRGRPRKFDEEEVLDVLTGLFWQQGYEGTSVADITRAAGLNKSSLYNTFGPKQELFCRILHRYIDARMSMLETLVDKSGGGIEGLHTFLEFLRAEVGSEMGRHGCMAVNTSAELGGDDGQMVDLAEMYRSRMSAAVRGVVERAAEAGEVHSAEVDHHADMLTMFMMGLSVTMRSGASNDEINRFIDSAHANVESWRV